MPELALVALAERLQRLCLERGVSVATAESCTGGLVAAAITAVPGSSGYFHGGFVTYANDAKATLLGVPEDVLARHGAVSVQTARAMASGARERVATSVAVSVTGISGPDGGSAEKPVGLTYIGLAHGDATDVRRFRWSGDRATNRSAAASAALEWLIETLESDLGNGPTE